MSEFPIITIAGVPNTGKSTLFNRIIGKRRALIHSDPGMTRDIFSERFNIDEKTFTLQDSGGFFPVKDIISTEINKRIFREVERSHLIIYLFDGRREILGYEKDLFLEIRKINKNIIPVINKVDNQSKFLLPTSYYSLKTDFTYISAEHNIGVGDLLESIGIFFKDHPVSTKKSTLPIMRISIMGKPNVGKSSIINHILNDEMAIVSPIPGTTRDSVNFEIKRKGKKFIIVDNAGIRKLQKVKESTESAAVIRAERDLINADIVIFVVDVSKKLDQNDLLIAKKVIKSAKPVIVACNKWDLVEDKSKLDKLLGQLKRTLNSFYFAKFIIVSAKTGKSIFDLIDISSDINEFTNNRMSTKKINEIFQSALSEKKFYTESGKGFNPKFVSIESYRPFFLKIRSNSGRLKSADETFLKKKLSLKIENPGIPLFFKIISKD
ncbi:MAG: ribosome biogenesis GTPase Der [Candidatus Aminicenantes bacterium]|nr:ribosome biogenesis GTPase Der [Candidatus Aminicenantes bacterium]